ncbi:hypothetical protein PV963_16015 [Streptomyces coeruleorubidus]|uniref:hypothetical protein n=1 Tax=Streptomyces coeruleorubidus TaxID=116188 RepID=UPI00237FBB15|nr:hypothetical protein [Streptomyces coeruleorubidus]WDV51773.1 hypothetical protein PV963_16015 [Streptomyces coeruleorubidus]
MPRAWGRITGVTVNGATWSAKPGRMLVFDQVVRLPRTVAALLVAPPDTSEEAAEPLMAAAASGHV